MIDEDADGHNSGADEESALDIDKFESANVEVDPPAATAGKSLDLSPIRLAMIVGLAAVVALSGLCSWLGFQAYHARQDAHLRALLLQVGRQAAINLTTIDYQHADDDVKRIIDSATGEFYDEFQKRSVPFIDVVKKAESKSVGTITEAGLESVTGDEGQVMVAVSVKTTNKAEKGDQPPRYWRMRINVQKFGDEAKVAKVEFVP